MNLVGSRVRALRLERKMGRQTFSNKLETLAKHFSLPASISHRALEDCEQTLQLYRKLNETE